MWLGTPVGVNSPQCSPHGSVVTICLVFEPKTLIDFSKKESLTK
jgi:hypothetical protein